MQRGLPRYLHLHGHHGRQRQAQPSQRLPDRLQVLRDLLRLQGNVGRHDEERDVLHQQPLPRDLRRDHGVAQQHRQGEAASVRHEQLLVAHQARPEQLVPVRVEV